MQRLSLGLLMLGAFAIESDLLAHKGNTIQVIGGTPYPHKVCEVGPTAEGTFSHAHVVGWGKTVTVTCAKPPSATRKTPTTQQAPTGAPQIQLPSN
jgi:hypothetical protein